jgi:hypothetical protein
MRCKSSKHSLNLMQTPPPPRFAWSPSPAFAGADDFNRSRGASERPSYEKPLSEVVTTGLDPVVHADASRPSAGGSACASEASAWMPGSSPGMTDERTKRKDSEAKRRQPQFQYSAVPTGTAAPGSPGAHLSAFHRGSRPRESFIARDSASGQASWDAASIVAMRVLAAPAYPSPAIAPRAPVVVPER